MATGPLKRLTITVDLDPVAGAAAGKLDTDALSRRINAAVTKIVKSEDCSIETEIRWWLPTMKGFSKAIRPV